MRRILRAYRNNPIAPDAALELVKYAVDMGGDLRIEFTKADGTAVQAIVTPETAYVTVSNFRDSAGRPVDVGEKKRGPLTIDLTRIRSVEPVGRDLKVEYAREDGAKVTALVTPEKYTLIAKNFRDLEQKLLYPRAAEKRSIDLTRIKSMGYVEPFDRKDAITSASGAYRFLHPDFLASFEYAGQKYASLSEAVAALEETRSASPVGVGSTTAVVADLMRRKFSIPALARMLLASGDRPFAILAAQGGVVGSNWAVDINPILTALRQELIETGTVSPSKLLSPRITAGEIPTSSPTGSEAYGFRRLVSAELQAEIDRAVTARSPELASSIAPDIEVVSVEEINLDEAFPYDALIYIRTNKSDSIPGQLAKYPGRIAYLVIDQPADYMNTEASAARVADWMSSHPYWRYALSLPPSNTQRDPIDRMKSGAFAYRLIADARSRDVFEPRQKKALSTLYGPTGNLVIPFDGTIVDMVKRASDVIIVIETEPSLPARHAAVDAPAEGRVAQQTAWLEGLAKKVPTRTDLGSYVMTGLPPKLMVHEVLVVPRDRAPAQSLIGLNVEAGQEIILTGTPTDFGPMRVEDLNIDGIVELVQMYPVTTAPVLARYNDLSMPLRDRNQVAAVINAAFVDEAAAKRRDHFLISSMSKEQKQEFIDEMGRSDAISPNPVKDAINATLALADELIRDHGYTEDEADHAAETVMPLPEATPVPVFYFLLLDSKNRKAYTTGEVGALPEQDQKYREQVIQDALTAGIDEKLIERADFTRFMSDVPLNPRRLLRMIRPLRTEHTRGVFEVLLPAIKRGEGDKVLRWMPIPRGFGKGSKEAVAEIRSAMGTLTAASVVRGQTPGGKPSSAMIRLHRGGGPLPGDKPFAPSLREAAPTGRVSVGGMAATVAIPGSPSTAYASTVYLAGRGTRLTAYLDQLASQIPATAASSAELQKSIGSLTRGYGTQAPPELRGRERGAWTRDAKLEEGYVSPAEALRKAAEEAKATLEDPNASDIRKSAAELVIQQYEQLRAVQGEVERRKQEEVKEKERKFLQAKGTGYVGMFLYEFHRTPTMEEKAVMAKAVQDRKDPIEAVRAMMKQNPGKDSGEFDLFGDEPAPEETAAAPSKPPPAVPPPPPEEAPSARPAAPPPSTALALPTIPPRRATLMPGSVGSPFVSRPRGEAEALPEESEVKRARTEAGKAWSIFNGALRKERKDAPSAAQVVDFFQIYKTKAAELQEVLDRRDRALLEKKGPTYLSNMLRNEAAESMSMVSAAYARARKGDPQLGLQARQQIVREIGSMLDPMGRPYAPPSAEELAKFGLTEKQLTEGVQGRRFAGLGEVLESHALTYPKMMEAARIAADATRAAPKKGQAMSSISCRVLRSDQWVRRRMDQTFISRILNAYTYMRQKGASGFVEGKANVIWISPNGDHAIFYVNGIGMCEFHNADFERLLVDVLHYAQDWFNDPRSFDRAYDYSLWIGQSGPLAQSANLYQIWGRWLDVLPATGTSGLFTDEPPAVMTGDEAYSRLKKLVTVTKSGLGPPRLLEGKDSALKPLILRWISNESARALGFEDMQGALEAEAAAYSSAMGAFAPPRAGPAEAAAALGRPRAASQALAMATAELAMEGKTFGVTLFYPSLYGKGGDLRERTGTPANQQTGLQVQKQLESLAVSVPDGAVIRIFDHSLFAGEVAQSVLDSPQMSGSAGYRTKDRFITPKVPTPFAFLREKLKGRDVRIEVVLPDRPALRAHLEEATAAREGYPPVTTVTARGSNMFEMFGRTLLPGSILVLWNDPDMPGSNQRFGALEGLQQMANVVADNLPLIKSVIVETDYETRKIGGAQVEEPYMDPQELRAEVLAAFAERIEKAGSDVHLYHTALGVPEDVIKAAGVRQGQDPSDTANSILNEIAKKYKVDPLRYFRPGRRRYQWAGDENALANRGRTRLRPKTRYLRR